MLLGMNAGVGLLGTKLFVGTGAEGVNEPLGVNEVLVLGVKLDEVVGVNELEAV
jgi:hypothetical protein